MSSAEILLSVQSFKNKIRYEPAHDKKSTIRPVWPAKTQTVHQPKNFYRSLGDNLHEVSDPFLRKNKKNIIKYDKGVQPCINNKSINVAFGNIGQT